MTDQPASPDDEAATERQIECFIACFTPEIAARARACRAVLRSRLPSATELVYDNYNAVAIAYSPDGRSSHAIVSLAIYPKIVALYFMDGRQLPDPHGVLLGEGAKGAFVRLSGPETLDDPVVDALLNAAFDRAPVPLPASAAGRTIVKSISAKQRPRRPAIKEHL